MEQKKLLDLDQHEIDYINSFVFIDDAVFLDEIFSEIYYKYEKEFFMYARGIVNNKEWDYSDGEINEAIIDALKQIIKIGDVTNSSDFRSNFSLNFQNALTSDNKPERRIKRIYEEIHWERDLDPYPSDKKIRIPLDEIISIIRERTNNRFSVQKIKSVILKEEIVDPETASDKTERPEFENEQLKADIEAMKSRIINYKYFKNKKDEEAAISFLEKKGKIGDGYLFDKLPSRTRKRIVAKLVNYFGKGDFKYVLRG